MTISCDIKVIKNYSQSIASYFKMLFNDFKMNPNDLQPSTFHWIRMNTWLLYIVEPLHEKKQWGEVFERLKEIDGGK